MNLTLGLLISSVQGFEARPWDKTRRAQSPEHVAQVQGNLGTALTSGSRASQKLLRRRLMHHF